MADFKKFFSGIFSTGAQSLTEGSIPLLLTRFAIPYMAANLLQALYGAADMIIVGQFTDAAGLSAVSIGSQFIFMINSIVIGLSIGGTIMIGRFFGEKLFSNPNSKIFKQSYLEKTNAFYAKHGGKTIFLARFVPIVRTFAPFVAGMGHMGYRHFAIYNVAGAIVWVFLFTYAGRFFGNIPVVQKNLELLMLAIIVISVLPAVVEVLRERHKARKAAREAREK